MSAPPRPDEELVCGSGAGWCAVHHCRRAFGLPAAAAISDAAAGSDTAAVRQPLVRAQSHTRRLRVVERDAAGWRPAGAGRGRRATGTAAVVCVAVVLVGRRAAAAEQHGRERDDED
jgi:hypothetical protein